MVLDSFFLDTVIFAVLAVSRQSLFEKGVQERGWQAIEAIRDDLDAFGLIIGAGFAACLA